MDVSIALHATLYLYLFVGRCSGVNVRCTGAWASHFYKNSARFCGQRYVNIYVYVYHVVVRGFSVRLRKKAVEALREADQKLATF